jgi:hypothetical protein
LLTLFAAMSTCAYGQFSPLVRKLRPWNLHGMLCLVVFAVSAYSVMRLSVLEMKLLSFSNLDTPIDIWSSSRCNFSTVTAMRDVLQRRNCCKTLVHFYRELILGFFHLIVLHAQLIQLRGTHVALELSVLLDRSLDAQLLFPLFVCARQGQQ